MLRAKRNLVYSDVIFAYSVLLKIRKTRIVWEEISFIIFYFCFEVKYLFGRNKINKFQQLLHWAYMQNISRIFGKISGLIFSYKTRKIFVSICLPTVGFRGTSPTFARPQSLIFICGDTCQPYCIQLRLKMKKHFTNSFFVPVKLFTTAPGSLKVCDSPRSDVSIRALIQMGDILSICDEL